MATLCILPHGTNDNVKRDRVVKSIQKRWSNQLDFYVLDSYVDDYSEISMDIKIVCGNGLILDLTNDWLAQCEEQYGVIYKRVVILVNNAYRNDAISWSSDFRLKIYKELPYFGFGGLELAHGLSDEDDYEHLNKHIFNKVTKYIDWSESPVSLNFFPYHGYARLNMFGDINDIGFRASNDLTELLYRPKSHKLIVFLGGSGCMDIFADGDVMISQLLQEKLRTNLHDEISVVNFGMGGATLVDEIAIYMLYLWKLKPDIVISWDGYNERCNGLWNDPFLMESYDLFYMYQLEEFASRLQNKKIDYKEVRRDKSKLDQVVHSYIARKIQLKRMVEGRGATFVSVLQPLLSCRTQMSDFEKQRLSEDHHIEVSEFTDKVLHEIKKTELKGCFLDANDFLRRIPSSEVLFADPCHQFPNANSILSEGLFAYLMKNYGDLLQ